MPDCWPAAYCVRQHPLVTFWRRLTRDLRERRKPPLVLVRRGLALMRDQQRVVEDAVAKGCRPVTPEQAYAEIPGSRSANPPMADPLVPTWAAAVFRRRFSQPDQPTCGPTCLVAARILADEAYAAQGERAGDVPRPRCSRCTAR